VVAALTSYVVMTKRLTGVVDNASLEPPGLVPLSHPFCVISYRSQHRVIDCRLPHRSRKASHGKALPALGLWLTVIVPLIADGRIDTHKHICAGESY
jgi:hypothetical protein